MPRPTVRQRIITWNKVTDSNKKRLQVLAGSRCEDIEPTESVLQICSAYAHVFGSFGEFLALQKSQAFEEMIKPAIYQGKCGNGVVLGGKVYFFAQFIELLEIDKGKIQEILRL
jgi:hypothetical protein